MSSKTVSEKIIKEHVLEGKMEDGIMTGDLARLSDPPARKTADTEEFIDEIAACLEK